MAEAKKANYTEEMRDALVSAYESAEDSDDAREAVVQEFAAEFGKDPRSIRAKLVREGVYIAKTRTTKTGGKVERKAAIVEDIASALGVDSDIVGSLESATKNALTLVRSALRS